MACADTIDFRAYLSFVKDCSLLTGTTKVPIATVHGIFMSENIGGGGGKPPFAPVQQPPTTASASGASASHHDEDGGESKEQHKAKCVFQ